MMDEPQLLVMVLHDMDGIANAYQQIRFFEVQHTERISLLRHLAPIIPERDLKHFDVVAGNAQSGSQVFHDHPAAAFNKWDKRASDKNFH